MDKKLVIFCSASSDIDPIYNEVAREVVRAACKKGYSIVSGGAIKGTMKVVADEVAAVGGYHTGVIPRFMEDVKYPGLNESVIVDTMAERKAKMREGTSVAIALPGGIGTLDELVETHTLAKLDKYHGKVLALNINGFYEPLKRLLEYYVSTGMMTRKDMELLRFVDTVEDLVMFL